MTPGHETEVSSSDDRNFYDRITYVVGRAVGYGCLLGSVGLLGYEVFARYILNAPTRFTLEFGLIGQVMIGAFAGAYILQKGGHVGIDLVFSRLPERIQARVHLVNLVCGALLSALLVVIMFRATRYAWKMDILSETLELSLWPVYALFLLGLLMLFGQFVSEFIKALRRLRAGP